MVRRPLARRIMKKIRRVRVADTKTYSGTIGYTDLVIETSRGHWKRRIDKAPGSREWPLSAAERRDKFLDCAATVLASEQASAWHAIAERCSALPDIGDLTRLCVPLGERNQPMPTSYRSIGMMGTGLQ